MMEIKTTNRGVFKHGKYRPQQERDFVQQWKKYFTDGMKSV